MLLLRISVLLFAGVVTGCATSPGLHQARAEFANGAPVQALKTLEQAEVSNRDRLLLLLDKGAVSFSAGQYTQARQALLAANDLIDEWDQLLIGEQSATLVTSEWAKRYRGEYSEQLWVHTYLMMVFLLQNQPESAAVEARRALQRMDEREELLEHDWFTRALMALSFEAAGAHDSAQVEYRKLLNDNAYDGRWNQVAQRHSRRIGRGPIKTMRDNNTDTGNNNSSTSNQLAADEGELIVFLQTGVIPRKQPGDLTIDIDLRIAFPFYAEPYDAQPAVTVTTNKARVPSATIDTRLVSISKNALDARGNIMATKQIARLAAKKALVDVASREDELLGGVVQILMFATEQADTRSWETLPAWMTLVRVPLPEGQQNVELAVTHLGVNHRFDLGTIDIKAGKLHFSNIHTNLPIPLTDGAVKNMLLEEARQNSMNENAPETAPALN